MNTTNATYAWSFVTQIFRSVNQFIEVIIKFVMTSTLPLQALGLMPFC